MSKAIEFAQKVTDIFAERITDQVFLFIESNDELLKEYLELVSETNLQTVNPAIGKQVAKRFNVDEVGRESNPESILIKSHAKF